MSTAGPETYLEVLEDFLGRLGLALAHCGSKNSDRGGSGKIFLLLLFFFVSFIFFSVGDVVLIILCFYFYFLFF